MAHVTLIRGPSLIPKWSDSGPLTPPIGPAYLAASLREAGHAVQIIDGLGEKPSQVTSLFAGRMIAFGLTSEEIAEMVDPKTDLVGVSCMFSQDWPEVRRLIELVRRRLPNTPIVTGGEHINAVREFTLEACPAVDFCVLGEGEEILVDLTNSLESGKPLDRVGGMIYRGEGGKPHLTGPRARIKKVDDIPYPAWDLVPIHNYLDQHLGYGVDLGRSMAVIATRGCPYQCTFCSNPQMWTTRWIARDPNKVLDEIEFYMRKYDATNFDFYDLTAIVKRQWIIDFCHLILKRGLKFTWQLPSGTRSEAIDSEVTRLLYESGCRNLSYAPESGSPAVLQRIKKKVHLDRMERSMRSAIGNGLNLKLNIIMGFPDEKRSEIWQTIGFLAKVGLLGVHDASVSMFSPYPGSELYDQMRAQGRIPELSDEYFLSLGSYKDFTQTVSFAHGMSTNELGFYRILGMLVFYGVQYAVRPWRLVGTIVNLFRQRQVSRLDKSLQDLAKRILGRHETPVPKGKRQAA